MTTVLAQAPHYTTDQLGIWVAIALALIAGAVGVKKLVSRGEKRISPQPLVIQPAPNYVTAEQHEKAIGELKAELMRHAARRAEIYTEQKHLATQIAEVRAKTDLTHAQLQTIDSKVDRILQNLPRT